MGQFTPGQRAILTDLFAAAEDNSVLGRWLADGTIPFAKGVFGAFATGAQGLKADTALPLAQAAYGWGNHAAAGYAPGAQGTQGATAYGWGNHALAGYLTAHRTLKMEQKTPMLGTTTALAGTPAAGNEMQVFQAGALLDPTAYTYTATTKVFTGFLADVLTTIFYME